MLNNQAIEEFRTLYQQETGILLSLAEARHRAQRFMKLVKRVVEENYKRGKVMKES